MIATFVVDGEHSFLSNFYESEILVPWFDNLPAKSAAMGQRQFRKMEGAEECSFLRKIGNNARRKTIVDLFAESEEDDAELLAAQAVALRLSRAPKLLNDAGRESLNWKCRLLRYSGWLLGGHGQDQIGGLGRCRIHAPEDTASAPQSAQEKATTRSARGSRLPTSSLVDPVL